MLAQWLMFAMAVIRLLLSPGIVLAQDAEKPPSTRDAQNGAAQSSSDHRQPNPVEQLIGQRCLGCHSGAEPRGEIDLTRPAAVAKDGQGVAGLETSPLWHVVVNDEMPPDQPLSLKEKAILREWVRAGAPADFEPIDPFRFTTGHRAGYDWWSLQPLRRPAAPPLTDGSGKTAIDAFVLRKLQQQALTLSPPADPRLQIRRLYLDLIGLPPPASVTAEFVRNPTDAVWASIVDNLLSSPDYGERWGRHWLDIVRFGESDGFERNAPRRETWRYRDWVIDALNSDMPFDEFARRQIAGDALCDDPVEGMAATGFLVAGLHNTVVGSSKQMQLLARQDEMEDLVGTIGQTFAGLTFNCARCHDHKFDPITQHEYYQLVATVAGVSHGIRQARIVTDQKRIDELSSQIDELSTAILNLEEASRREILEERRAGNVPATSGPQPLMEWQFAGSPPDFEDRTSLQLAGNARLTAKGLELGGDGDFACSLPIAVNLGEKTLEAWVVLNGLDQRGGAAISLETADGSIFDAIVFGEQEPQRWMAGSNGFSRTASFAGEAEADEDKPIQLAIVYQSDGTITAWRNGQPYGMPYSSSGPQLFAAGSSRLLFGLRHSPPGGNRFLKGTIVRARLYDRALSPNQIAASAGLETNYISDAELENHLSAADAAMRSRWLDDRQQLIRQRVEREASSLVSAYTAVSTVPGDTFFLPRGDVLNPADVVPPGTTAAVSGLSASFHPEKADDESMRRVQLASWLTDPANPLFARVAVNRLWHYHFGRGLIATPNDFGFNGGRPSHPELLDWLAEEFRSNGYHLKPLHKLIVTSAVYRQGSMPNADAQQLDSDNRLLWRKTPTRLDAEVVRDSVLVIGGKLNRKRGGPGYEDVRIIDRNNGTTYYESFDGADPALNRRTIYRFAPRGGRSALLDSLDCPDPSAATPRRSVTSTPLQALSLLNSDFMIRLSNDFAARATKEKPGRLPGQVNWMFEESLGRAADAEELAAATTLAETHGLPALARALFNSNEFMIVQ